MREPTRSFKEIMSPSGPARITQMSDFLKIYRPPGEDLPRHRGTNRMKVRLMDRMRITLPARERRVFGPQDALSSISGGLHWPCEAGA